MRPSTVVQTYLFSRFDWTAQQARTWLRRHKKIAGWLDETDDYWRFRQLDPDLFDKQSFRTVTLPGIVGVKIVTGHMLGNPGTKSSKSDDDPYRTRLRNRGKADRALSAAQGTLVLGFTEELKSEATALYDHIERFRRLINKPIRTKPRL